jgi:hypothetical protein
MVPGTARRSRAPPFPVLQPASLGSKRELAQKFSLIWPHLSERAWWMMAAKEARQLGSLGLAGPEARHPVPRFTPCDRNAYG